MILFFLLENNLEPLQKWLRSGGHSVFLPNEPEIGLSINSSDPEIVQRIAEQKTDLGVDRIIITRDSDFINFSVGTDVKVILLTDKSGKWDLYLMHLKRLAETIFAKGFELVQSTPGQAVGYVECSKFY